MFNVRCCGSPQKMHNSQFRLAGIEDGDKSPSLNSCQLNRGCGVHGGTDLYLHSYFESTIIARLI